MIHSIKSASPDIAQTVFVACNAEIIGDVCVGENSGIWFGAVLRADVGPIRIGKNTNIQDGVVIHEDSDFPCIIGNDVTVGHRAVLHGCNIGDGCLIGMGAIILDGAKIGENCIVGAGSLVLQGKEFPSNSLIIGSPARAIRQVSQEELDNIRKGVITYVKLAKDAINFNKKTGEK